jgi:uncharacterized protein (TIGR03067 family)
MGALSLFATEDTKEQLIQKDRKLMAGTWEPVSVEYSGWPLHDRLSELVIIEADGNMRVEKDGKVMRAAKTMIDPTQNPKAIDFEATAGEYKGDKMKGIYDLAGDILKVCRTGPDGERPTEFSSKLGSGVGLGIYRRKK